MINKRKLLTLSFISIIGLSYGIGKLVSKNRKQAGIIRNQQQTITGLLKDVQKLSYHLGKEH